MNYISNLFISRTKDNQSLKGFKPRSHCLLTKEGADQSNVISEFEQFVSEGLPGEKVRRYVAVNLRDHAKTHQALLIHLINHPEQPLDHLSRKVKSFATKPENAATKRWLFDFDAAGANASTTIDNFVADVKQYGKFSDKDLEVYPTVSGYGVITARGFYMKDLLEQYPNVELKRDDYKFIEIVSKDK